MIVRIFLELKFPQSRPLQSSNRMTRRHRNLCDSKLQVFSTTVLEVFHFGRNFGSQLSIRGKHYGHQAAQPQTLTARLSMACKIKRRKQRLSRAERSVILM